VPTDVGLYSEPRAAAEADPRPCNSAFDLSTVTPVRRAP
jgi:hypothetical protein